MKDLTELLTYRALHFKLSTFDSSSFFADSDGSDERLQIKNVCAKLPVQLSDRIDETTAILQISKRRFIEAALVTALDEADRVMEELDIFKNTKKNGESE